MNFEQKVMRNIELYANDGIQNVVDMFASTVKLFRDQAKNCGINVTYNGVRMQFIPVYEKEREKIHITCEKTAQNISAWYNNNHNLCKFGINSAKNFDLHKIHLDAVHESSHSIQDDLIRMIDKYDKSTPEYDYLYRMKAILDNNNNPRRIFGIKLSGKTYVNYQKPATSVSLDELCYAFYTLAVTERHASYMSNKYSAQFTGISDCLRPIEASVSKIQERYVLYDCDENEIGKMIDDAYLCVYEGRIPQNEVLAKITYDLAVSIAYQEASIDKQTYLKMMHVDYRDNIVKQYIQGNRQIVHDMPIKLDITDCVNIELLEDVQRKFGINDNMILFNAIILHGDRGCALVKNVEEFKTWLSNVDFCEEQIKNDILDNFNARKNEPQYVVTYRSNCDDNYHINNENEGYDFDDFTYQTIGE